ncbi:FAD-dependent oxidoreductase [Actinocorallia sp. B10E7]|uniref:hydroxysqualene dehydroxylase n=1 Tax=Actinocorallia sp. B10E7 TaxID=3153558 RepID=UPI00325D070F
MTIDLKPSRRQILAGTALALVPVPAFAAPKQNVAVLGGGMSGLAVAHELIERGFTVDVYERKALGGKARSIPVPGTGSGGRGPLPGEHGFRFFPGFYRHVTDTMRRIPFTGKAGGVRDNLVNVSAGRLSRSGGRADLGLPDLNGPGAGGLDAAWLRETFTGLLQQVTSLPALEIAFFVNRYLVYMTSGEARRYGQWENVSWWDFIRAEGKSAEYKTIVAKFLTRGLVAVKEEVASTRTVGNMGQAFLLSAFGLGNDGDAGLARMLNAPTNEAWIDPWTADLRAKGVRFHLGRTVEALEVKNGRIDAAHAVDTSGRRHRIEADWFVCAVPPDRAVRLWSAEILEHAPELEGTRHLHTDWMNGIQFYLRKTPRGLGELLSFMDSPWQLTAILQSGIWNRDFGRDYGDGTVADCLSLDISDWDTPGILYGRPAKRCTPAQIAKECWAQMKAHLEDTGSSVLPDDILHSWFLDPAITWHPDLGRNTNDELLTVNTIGTWTKRPKARTGIPNLFVAGDYVQTSTDLATMESANESARAAVNALLEAADSPAAPAKTWKLYQPPELEALKKLDTQRYNAGRPNVFDV